MEVALSVQFAELRDYRSVHAGILWANTFRQEFPTFVEHPPLNPAFEAFGPRSPSGHRFELKQMAGMPVPRLWFVNSDETQLIQFQADRFVHNWRKTGSAGSYPRYEGLKARFFQELKQIDKFLQEERIGKIEPNQCEVTYVNSIHLSDGTDIRTRPEVALRCWSGLSLDEKEDPTAKLPPMENSAFSIRYILRSDGEPVGRLHVTAQPTVGQPTLRFDLSARGAPREPTMEALADFLDLGREAVVRGFTALTTPEMHRTWRRTK